jgi:2'-5' RNA ligase
VSDPTRRLFVALMLGEELGLPLVREVRRGLGAAPEGPVEGLALYGAREVHITLFFLGGVAAERAAALEERLEAKLAGAPMPELELREAGAFPSRGRERILWVGLREPAGGALADLQARVGTACTALGFAADERPWTPHLTVGRVRGARGRGARGGGVRIPSSFYDLDLRLGWKPPRASLVESLAGAAGERYREIRGFPLA